MSGALRWRRATLLVLAAGWFAAGAAPAVAQDPNAGVVQSVARDWLALTDKFDANGSWKAAGKKFRDAISVQRWAESLQAVREPVGPVAQRAVKSTQFAKTIPNQPDGDYALVVFRTGFDKKSDSSETVTLEREADGRWRVIGYFVR